MKTLNELFDSAVKYTTVSDRPTIKIYSFLVEDVKYTLHISASAIEDGGGWEVEFWDSTNKFPMNGITGSGNARAVLSTVVKILKDWVKKDKPELIMFSAKEKSRNDLYKAMAKKLGKGFKMKKDGNTFVLSRKSK